MKNEKDFDNAVKAKLESRVYTPDENSWAAAEKLITEQEAARRSGFGKYFIGLFAACGVLAVTGWFLLYSPEGSGSSTNKTAAVATGQQAAAQNKTNSADSFTNTTAASPAAAGNSTRPNGQFNAPQNMNSTSGSVSPTGTGSDANPENYTAAGKPGKTGTGNTKGSTNSGGKKTTADATANRGNKNAGTAGNTSGSQHTSAGTIASGDAKTDPGSASANNGSETIAVQDVNTNGTLKNKTNAASENGTGNSNGEVIASTADKNDSSSSAETIAAKPFIAVTTQETNDQESLTGPVQTGNNSTSTSKEDPTAPYWFVRGGLAYMPGFESTTTVGRSINPVLGGGYSHAFTKRLRIEAGLQFTTIGKASDSSRIYTSQNFGFGLEQERTEIGLQRLHYVAMPIQLRIAFGRKNALLAGVTPHYLFTAESRVRTYTLSHSTITNDKTTRVFGYNQGLRQTDLLVNAGYARSISDRLAVSAVFNFGLTDIKDNAYFRFEKTERHKNLQLLLLYKF